MTNTTGNPSLWSDEDQQEFIQRVRSWQEDEEFLTSEEVAEKTIALAPKVFNLRKDLYVVPSGDGHVIFEFRVGNTECTVEIQEEDMLFLCLDNISEKDGVQEIEFQYTEDRVLQFVKDATWTVTPEDAV